MPLKENEMKAEDKGRNKKMVLKDNEMKQKIVKGSKGLKTLMKRKNRNWKRRQ